ncbi:hypothetical protein Ga0100231_002505 [Opitutaceae bacterium TAV4]|nr:hypothetical protein Ga0100231_002505 [Opitutaceae bacterium TAV4]RRK01814.1 hypothetical protein Ga0100230_000645 [Opitutaceae bacterium TAV3]
MAQAFQINGVPEQRVSIEIEQGKRSDNRLLIIHLMGRKLRALGQKRLRMSRVIVGDHLGSRGLSDRSQRSQEFGYFSPKSEKLDAAEPVVSFGYRSGPMQVRPIS